MNEKTRHDFLQLLQKCHPRQRATSVQTIEGRASADGVAYTKEELSFLEPDLTTRKVTLFAAKQCDCGLIISAKNTLKGICQHPRCRRYCCSDCALVCRCGRVFGPCHATQYKDGDVYCYRCRPVKWLKLFFDIHNLESQKWNR